MAISYRVDPPTGIVVFQDDGPFEFYEWERAVLDSLEDSATSRRRFLSDRRRHEAPLSIGLVEQIVDFLWRHSLKLGEAQWAIVANPGTPVRRTLDLGEELARSTRVRVKAFSEIRPALAWLLPVVDELEVDRLARWVDQG